MRSATPHRVCSRRFPSAAFAILAAGFAVFLGGLLVGVDLGPQFGQLIDVSFRMNFEITLAPWFNLTTERLQRMLCQSQLLLNYRQLSIVVNHDLCAGRRRQ